MRFLIWPAFLLLILSGCATRPAIMTAEAGAMPPSGGFRILGGSAEQGMLERELAAKLEARGFSADAKGPLLVQISQSEPPAKTGLTAAQASEAQWLVEPTRSKSQRVRRLVVTVTDVPTGREIYRATGTERYRQGKSDRGERLRTSLLALLP